MYSDSTPLPSISILGKRRKYVSKKNGKVVTWDREIICLPNCCTKFSSNGVLPISRKKKDVLASFGLVGRLHLESDWSESEVLAEIRSTFHDNLDENTWFKFLQVTGVGSKSLMIPKLSASYKWTPKEVAGRADRPIYVLLQDDIAYEVLCYESHISQIYSSVLLGCRLTGNEVNETTSAKNPLDSWEPPPSPCVPSVQSSSSASQYDQPAPSPYISSVQPLSFVHPPLSVTHYDQPPLSSPSVLSVQSFDQQSGSGYDAQK